MSLFLNSVSGFIFIKQVNHNFNIYGGLNVWEIRASEQSFFNTAVIRFDYANSQDPNQEVDEHGASHPRELLYSRRLYSQVEELIKTSDSRPESLLLAARSQHIMRWKIPRQAFPICREGYLDWRTKCKQFHARTSSTILTETGSI